MADGFTRQTVSLPPVMLSDLKKEAKRRDLTLSQLIREYIRSGRLRATHGTPDLQREGGSDDDSR